MDSLNAKKQNALVEAEKLSRRLAQHTDLRLENMWGEFCAQIEWTKNKLKKLDSSQSQEKEILLHKLIDDFFEVLAEPGARDTPSSIMAGIFLDEFLKNHSL